MISPISLFLAILACNGGHGEGTAVGNPGSSGSLDVVVTGAPDGVSLDVAEAAIDGFSLDDCQGGDVWVDAVTVFDALPATPDAVEVQGGSWCGLALSFSTELDPLALEGSTSGGTVFRVALDPGPLQLSADFEVDATELLLEIPLGEALDPATLESMGEDVMLNADDPQAVSWASGIGAASDLWEDLDGDDAIGAGDARFSDGAATAMDSNSAGCGCASGGHGLGRAGWGLALALALARRRRLALS